MNRRIALIGIALVGILLLTGCGGGGVEIPAQVLRTDLLYGYWSSAAAIAQMAGQCNIGWIADWDVPGNAKVRIQACVDAGVTKVVLGCRWLVYGANGYLGTQMMRANMAPLLNELAGANLLQYVVALYPIDEPDGLGYSDADVTRANQDIRQLLKDMAYAPLKLACVYGSQGRKVPGFYSYDWVGFDDYDAGDAIFKNGEYDAFASLVLTTQRVILVPGGASPWSLNPSAFMAKAESDPRVIMVAPFIWVDYPVPGATKQGIGSNGMASAYCVAGNQVVRPGQPPLCGGAA